MIEQWGDGMGYCVTAISPGRWMVWQPYDITVTMSDQFKRLPGNWDVL